jgi:hypothetical protein
MSIPDVIEIYKKVPLGTPVHQARFLSSSGKWG